MGGAPAAGGDDGRRSCIAVECSRAARDAMRTVLVLQAATIDRRWRSSTRATDRGVKPVSVGLLATPTASFPKCCARPWPRRPGPTRPSGMIRSTAISRRLVPAQWQERARCADHQGGRQGSGALHGGEMGARCSDVHGSAFPRDSGNPTRPDGRREEGVRRRVRLPASCRYIRRCSVGGIGTFAVAALVRATPSDISADAKVKELIRMTGIDNWLAMARSAHPVSRAASRIVWVGSGDRQGCGLRVKRHGSPSGALKAARRDRRDHPRLRSVGLAHRDTEAMARRFRSGRDGRVNALLNCASARHVSRCLTAAARHGLLQHAGMVVVCDGSGIAKRVGTRWMWTTLTERRHAQPTTAIPTPSTARAPNRLDLRAIRMSATRQRMIPCSFSVMAGLVWGFLFNRSGAFSVCGGECRDGPRPLGVEPLGQAAFWMSVKRELFRPTESRRGGGRTASL